MKAPTTGRPKQPFHCYVWFDAHDELPDKNKGWADYLNYFQHAIYVGKAYRRSDTGEFVNLKYAYLLDVIPERELGRMKRWLVGDRFNEYFPENGTFIFTDEKYYEATETSEGKCLGYRVHDRFADKSIRRVPIRDERLSDKIKGLERRDYKKFTSLMRHMFQNIQRVDIDFAAAIEMLKSYPFDIKEWSWEREQDARQSTEYLLTLIRDKKAELPHRCNYLRVHHQFCALASGFRSHLMVNGRYMVNIDIANSQPLFLYLSIVPYIISSNLSDLSTVPLVSACRPYGCFAPSHSLAYPSCPSHHAPLSSLSSAPTSLQSLHPNFHSPESPSHSLSYTIRRMEVGETEVVDKEGTYGRELMSEMKGQMIIRKYPDLANYKAMVEGGKLYQFLMDEINWTGSKQRFKDECVFKFYYGPNNDRDSRGNRDPCKLKPVFQKHFPSVWEAIRGFKKKNGWKELAREMQRSEARVMIDGVCERLRVELPESIWFSIHDSIMCEPQHVTAVKGIIMDEMAKVGLRPTLGTTDYSERDVSVAA